MRTDSWPGLRFADRQCHLTGGGGGGGTSAPNPQDFLPPGQAQVAQQARGLIDPLASQGGFALGSISPQAGPPATYAYPFVTNTFQNAYGAASPMNDPFAAPLMQGGQLASDIFGNLLYPEATAYSAENANIAGQGINMLPGIAGNTYGNPLYGQAGQFGQGLAGQYGPEISQLLNAFQNPAFAQAGGYGSAGSPLLFGNATNILNTLAPNLLSEAVGTGTGLQNLGGQVAGLSQSLDPVKNALSGYASGLDPVKAALGGYASSLDPLAASIQQSAFDPQQALYNRTQQQILDQQNAVNAMSGVASSPYGAGVTGKTLSDFNIDWQNNLLNRQLQGAQGINALRGEQGALQQGIGQLAGLQGNLQQGIGALTGQQGNLLQAGGGLQNMGFQDYLSGLQGVGNLYGQAGNLMGQAQQLAMSPAQASQQALFQGGNIGSLVGDRGLTSLLNPANAQTSAYGAGVGAFGGLGSDILGQQQGGLGILSQLGPQAIQSLGAPYNINQGIAGNQFSALGNLISQGNQQYVVPQQAFSDIAQYLGLGQGADQIAAQIAAQNFNQQAASAGGLGSLLGSGLNFLGGGRGGGLGGGGFGGGGLLSSLFGGGGSPAFSSSVVGDLIGGGIGSGGIFDAGAAGLGADIGGASAGSAFGDLAALFA